MLKFYAKEFIELGQVLGLIQLRMEPDPPSETLMYSVETTEGAVEVDALTLDLLSDPDGELRADFKRLADVCDALEMEVSAGLIKKRLTGALPKTNREFTLLSDALELELKSKRLLYVPKERVGYFENDRILSDVAKITFETAYTELREAGTCFALGRYTAAVLHAMRAAETGVKVLARELGYAPDDLEQQDWHPVLLKCESLIQEARDKMKKGPEKEAKLTFYSQMAVQFRHFKDGYRVQAAHARPPFQEGEARQILDATISFFELMADQGIGWKPAED